MDNTWSREVVLNQSWFFTAPWRHLKKWELFFSFAVTVTGGSDVGIGCLGPLLFPFHKELIHQECQKNLWETLLYIKWALESCPENLNRIFNMVALAETAVLWADFWTTTDKCCLFELNISTSTPIFFFNVNFLLWKLSYLRKREKVM